MPLETKSPLICVRQAVLTACCAFPHCRSILLLPPHFGIPICHPPPSPLRQQSRLPSRTLNLPILFARTNPKFPGPPEISLITARVCVIFTATYHLRESPDLKSKPFHIVVPVSFGNKYLPLCCPFSGTCIWRMRGPQNRAFTYCRSILLLTPPFGTKYLPICRSTPSSPAAKPSSPQNNQFAHPCILDNPGYLRGSPDLKAAAFHVVATNSLR